MLEYKTWLNVGPEIRITTPFGVVSFAHDTVWLRQDYTWQGCAMVRETKLAIRV